MSNQAADLVHKPIPGLIAGMAIPTSVGLLFNTFYNVVDTFYAGMISTQALAALGLSFPIFFVVLAFGTGVSSGVTALIANELGRDNAEKARRYAIQSISFSIILAILVSAAGFSFSPFLFRFLGATEEYLRISLSYMNVILAGAVFFLLCSAFNAILNANGNTRPNRDFLIGGFFLNLVLNPLLMFGWGFVPALEFKGIALATVIIQAIGAIYLGAKLKDGIFRQKGTLKLLIPGKDYLDIFKQGFPAGLNILTMSLGIFSVTYFISYFGAESVAAYGIAVRIEQIGLIPSVGLPIATLAIVGQNNGAGLMQRVVETIKQAQKYGIYMMMVFTAIFMIFANFLVGLFTDDPTVINVGATYLRIAAITSYAYVILMVNVAGLQGMKKPMYGFYMGLYRQLLAPITVYYLLTRIFTFGVHSIFIGILCINGVGAIFTWVYVKRILKRKMSSAEPDISLDH